MKISVKMKPIDVVIREGKYSDEGCNYNSPYCDVGINKDMVHFFGKEIVVKVGSKHHMYRDTKHGVSWCISKDWVEHDVFKLKEVDDMFDTILEGI